MLSRLARFTVRRRRRILVGSLIALVLAGAFGGSVAKHLSSGGFTDPNAESTKAEQALERVYHSGNPNLLLLVTARNGSVDDRAVAAEGIALARQLASEPGVSNVASYWTLGSPPPLRSNDRRQALVLALIKGTDDQVRDRIKILSPRYTRQDQTITVGVGGRAEVFRQVSSQVEKDLRKAEMISVPITLLLLVLIFGSVVAAGLPLGIGVLAIIGTFLILRVLASLTQVSIFSLNLTTAMGLGLAIDYSLFIVTRYREELGAGWGTREAIIRTVATAGRTVLFSALTVAISLAALLVFPLSFLRSFAYAGVGVVFMAAIGAIVVLPALLAALGDRVNRFSLFHRTPKTDIGQGFW